jgi:hypothetical protein
MDQIDSRQGSETPERVERAQSSVTEPVGEDVGPLKHLDSIDALSKAAEPGLSPSGGERHLVAEGCESSAERFRALVASAESGEVVGQEEDAHGGSPRRLSA